MAYTNDLAVTPALKTGPMDHQHRQKSNAPAVYTGCSLQSLRFLASFIIRHASTHSLELSDFSAHLNPTQTSCEKITTLTAMARSKQEGARLFDQLLTLLVEPEARVYRNMAPYALAQSWESSSEPLRGRNLAAFLWVLIKNRSAVTQRIEEKVLSALELDCFQLLAE